MNRDTTHAYLSGEINIHEDLLVEIVHLLMSEQDSYFFTVILEVISHFTCLALNLSRISIFSISRDPVPRGPDDAQCKENYIGSKPIPHI